MRPPVRILGWVGPPSARVIRPACLRPADDPPEQAQAGDHQESRRLRNLRRADRCHGPFGVLADCDPSRPVYGTRVFGRSEPSNLAWRVSSFPRSTPESRPSTWPGDSGPQASTWVAAFFNRGRQPGGRHGFRAGTGLARSKRRDASPVYLLSWAVVNPLETPEERRSVAERVPARRPTFTRPRVTVLTPLPYGARTRCSEW